MNNNKKRKLKKITAILTTQKKSFGTTLSRNSLQNNLKHTFHPSPADRSETCNATRYVTSSFAGRLLQQCLAWAGLKYLLNWTIYRWYSDTVPRGRREIYTTCKVYLLVREVARRGKGRGKGEGRGRGMASMQPVVWQYPRQSFKEREKWKYKEMKKEKEKKKSHVFYCESDILFLFYI